MPAIKTRTVPSLQKALSILELLKDSRGLTLSDLVDQSGLAKSSVHYLLVTLERCRYVERSEKTGRYLLGTKLLSLTNSVLGGLSLRQKSAPYLFMLGARTGLTVHLGILERNEAVLISKHGDQNAPGPATWIGKRMELHCTAIGKALLAFVSEAEIDAMIQAHPLCRHNENTIHSPQRFRDELKRVAAMRYALDDEEAELGMRCVGVPIFGPDRRALAAVSLAGTTSQIEPENVSYLVAELTKTAARIETTMAPSFCSSVARISLEEVNSVQLAAT